jgi:hypothetical protein
MMRPSSSQTLIMMGLVHSLDIMIKAGPEVHAEGCMSPLVPLNLV